MNRIESLTPDGRWPADVFVWQVFVSQALEIVKQAQEMLDETEQARATGFVKSGDRARFVIGRHALRYILAEYLHVAPRVLRFSYSRYGKPLLAGYPSLWFNVSHSGDRVLIALSRHRWVGVDIEFSCLTSQWKSIANLVCSPQELNTIAHLPADKQVAAFLRCWTAKEAILKGVGLGITSDLRSLSVNVTSRGAQVPAVLAGSLAGSLGALRFHWLQESNGYIGCVAYGELHGESHYNPREVLS